MTKTIALDIGHGSNTFPPSKGVYKSGKGYAEHDFNSKLAIEMERILKSNGFKVVMYQKPHSKDVSLTQRTRYYNAQKVDLVYSIHANYNANADANGRCVFYWHTSKESKKLAEIIVDEIKRSGYSTHGNGLHASQVGNWTNLHIVRESKMTAVLVENGFMSGNQDFELVFGSKQGEYIQDMAQAQVKAICRYFGVTFNSDKTTQTSNSKPQPQPQPKPSKPATKPSVNQTTSIVDYLNSKGINSSPANRKKLAVEYGVENYDLTAAKNTELLNKMRAGKPANKPVVKPKPTPQPSKNTRALRLGDSGSEVRKMQQDLAKVHFYPEKGAKNNGIDSYFGPKTLNALKRFQSVYTPKEVDGIYGNNTRAALSKVIKGK